MDRGVNAKRRVWGRGLDGKEFAVTRSCHPVMSTMVKKWWQAPLLLVALISNVNCLQSSFLLMSLEALSFENVTS
jgi:hypothetical protein